MNDRHPETGAPSASLILTVPAYSFVVALHLDCLGGFNRATFSTETFAAANGETSESHGSGPRDRSDYVGGMRAGKRPAAAAREAFKKELTKLQFLSRQRAKP
jgi:hypothetical protein